MSFNPLFIAWVAGNVALTNTMIAQQQDGEAERELERLREQFQTQQQEHQWALSLMESGWDHHAAMREAQIETRRRNVYLLLEEQLNRLESSRPNLRSESEYQAWAARERKKIEWCRNASKWSSHPFVIVSVLIAAWVTTIAAALILFEPRGTILTLVISSWIVIALGLALLIRKIIMPYLSKFYARAVHKANMKAEIKSRETPGFVTWQYLQFSKLMKKYWSSSVIALHFQSELKQLGDSPINGYMNTVIQSRSTKLLDRQYEYELERLSFAIEECELLNNQDLAREMLSCRSKEEQNWVRELISTRNPKPPKPISVKFRTDYSDGTSRGAVREQSAGPSKVRHLRAWFDGKHLMTSWASPERNPNLVASYLVRVTSKSLKDALELETELTACEIKFEELSDGQVCEVSVQVISEDSKGLRSKPVSVRYVENNSSESVLHTHETQRGAFGLGSVGF